MAVGIIITKADVDSQFGGVLRDLNVTFDRVAELKAWADQYTSANLQSMFSYTQGEADTLKSAIADADQLRTLYEGGATLGVAKDFRTFCKQLYGFGV